MMRRYFRGLVLMRPAAMISMSEDCYDCHKARGSVDTTFVQFYPRLLSVATLKRTLSPAYKP
jgi:hypothetical protein